MVLHKKVEGFDFMELAKQRVAATALVEITQTGVEFGWPLHFSQHGFEIGVLGYHHLRICIRWKATLFNRSMAGFSFGRLAFDLLSGGFCRAFMVWMEAQVESMADKYFSPRGHLC